jgi:hypothetical protein
MFRVPVKNCVWFCQRVALGLIQSDAETWSKVSVKVARIDGQF